MFVTAQNTQEFSGLIASDPLMLCAECGVWNLIESDVFCAWCGTEVFQVITRQYPIRVYLSPDPASSEKTFTTNILTNKSPKPIKLECTELPKWLRLQVEDAGLQVPPAAALDVTFLILTDQLDGPPLRTDRIVFEPTVSGDNYSSFQRAEIEVQLWPKPEVTLEPLELFTSQPNKKAYLTIVSESDIRVTAIRFEPPLLKFDSQGPVQVSLGDAQLPVETNLLNVSGKSHQVNYWISVEGIEELIEGVLELQIKRLPTVELLNLDKLEDLEVVPGSEQKFSLEITNRGDAALLVEDVKITNSNLRASVSREKFPARLEPNAEGIVELNIKVPLQSDHPVGVNRYWFQLKVIGNNAPFEMQCRFNIINELYPDFVALDFGTTDSAVAVIENGVAVNKRLEPGHSDPKIYSNILFTNFLQERPELPFDWNIGKNAKNFASLHRERFVKAVKTKLGSNKLITIDFRNIGSGTSFDLRPVEIIKFILMDLLKMTYQSLRRKPVKFVLSAPTRFTLRQKEILKQVFTKAASAVGINIDCLKVMDESLAAGLFYILTRSNTEQAIKGKKSSYSLMVVDFGGGTTDVTALRVQQSFPAKGDSRISRIEIVGAWGDPSLGGEPISTEIAAILASKFAGQSVSPETDRKQIEELEEQAEIVKIAVSRLLAELESFEGEQGLDVDGVIARGSAELRKQLADAMGSPPGMNDQDLAAYLTEYARGDRDIELTVARNEGPGTVRIKVKEVVAIYEERLKNFKQELKVFLHRISDNTRKQNREVTPDERIDVILLAGQSAQFPVVAQVLKDLARYPIEFVRDSRGQLLLKECVSRGALSYIAYLTDRKDLQIAGQDRLWTRLGLRVTGAMGFKFQELIPWGKRYPCESKVFTQPDFAVVSGDKVSLRILENLSLVDDAPDRIKLYDSFQIQRPQPSPSEYSFKLKIDEEGTPGVECKVGESWIEMEPQL